MVYYVPLVWVSCEFDSHCRLRMSFEAILAITALFFILTPILTEESQTLGAEDKTPAGPEESDVDD